MGKGFSKRISTVYPAIKMADKRTKIGDRKKLGTFSKVVVGSLPYQVVYNIYSQYGYGKLINQKTGICTQYDHLQNGLFSACVDLLNDQKLKNKDKIIVGVPYMIGCMLGGGDVNKVIQIINRIENKLNKIEFVACGYRE